MHSFRDPAGILCKKDDRIFRIIRSSSQVDLIAFLKSGVAEKFFSSGRVIRTWEASADFAVDLIRSHASAIANSIDGSCLVLEHQKVPFPSYPYEWPPEMLHSAGLCTLELAVESLDEGFGLKDATPYNILFCGPNPVFIDLLSFERREPRDPTWLPYAQFVRTFLLPLLASKMLGIPIDQMLQTRRDGIEPEELYRWLSFRQRLLPSVLTLVTLPRLLSSASRNDDGLYKTRLRRDPDQAAFILRSLLKGLRRGMRKASPRARKSTWSKYMEVTPSYTPEHFAQKEAFVREALLESKPAAVLDMGCNTGHFSRIAVQAGARVVAIDNDPVVVGSLWRNASSEQLDILPLVVNVTRPTPAIGWSNEENLSFLDRARSAFDMVLMLAVVHHMLVSERVPLPEILRFAADLTRRLLLIEYVAPDDPMFRKITRGRDHLHSDLNRESFEAVCTQRFGVIRSQHQGTRSLYLLEKK